MKWSSIAPTDWIDHYAQLHDMKRKIKHKPTYNTMNLYLITQDVNTNYDTFDSAVVVASCEADARLIHPSPYYEAVQDGWEWRTSSHVRTEASTGCWCAAEDVKVKLIGEATGQEAGSVICASFNAG
jgi:hypothetical protein